MPDDNTALKPEDLTLVFVPRANERDAVGIAALYEEDAVIACPRGSVTVGREAIRALWEKVLANAPRFEHEPPLPTLISGDIALTSTPPKDGTGARAQVGRRQADRTWLRLLDQPGSSRRRAARSAGTLVAVHQGGSEAGSFDEFLLDNSACSTIPPARQFRRLDNSACSTIPPARQFRLLDNSALLGRRRLARHYSSDALAREDARAQWTEPNLREPPALN